MTELRVQELALDSRLVKSGTTFIAVPGEETDGRLFIKDAIQKGASLVLVEAPYKSHNLQNSSKIPIVEISHLKDLVGFMASRFFDDPSSAIPVIGITGTNGKTSCSHFIAQILNFWKKSCGVMGTLGTGFLEKLQNTSLTTPDAITVHRYLAHFRDQKAFAVAMEVCSHALVQGRVNGVQFHTAVFTNLTQDHLDYHGNMDQYGQAKERLFFEHQPQHVVINMDDLYGQALLAKIIKKQIIPIENVIGYSTEIPLYSPLQKGEVKTSNLHLDDTGVHAHIQTPWGEGELHCSLLGRFNLSNVLAALAVSCIQGVPFETVLEAARHLKTVPGRMNRLGGNKQEPLVVVDYAHTPDALQQVLMALRPHCLGKLWCIFGCGGDRDRGKRPLMAAVAEQYSDKVVMTQDNPRTEDPNQIFDDMLKGFRKPEYIQVESDRIQAITKTILAADPLDLILIAGKGHENYQIIGTNKIPLDDRVEAEKALQGRT